MSDSDAIGDVPGRWDPQLFADLDYDVPGKVYVQRVGFVKGIAEFDASFFSISPTEAAIMDPAQRLVLEASFSSLHNAGFTKSSLLGSNTSECILRAIATCSTCQFPSVCVPLLAACVSAHSQSHAIVGVYHGSGLRSRRGIAEKICRFF